MKIKKLNESISDNPPFIEVDNPDKVDELGYSGAVEYDGLKIYGDEETLRQLERDLQESINEDVPMEYVDGDSLKALRDEQEEIDADRKRRKHNFELLHKIFDSHGYTDSEDYWTDKVFDIFTNAEEITVVDDASKVPDRTNDGQKVKYVISTPDADVDVHVDVYGDYVWVVTKQPLNEDVSKEWKPNTSFKHIKDIYDKVKANNYKYVNNEREEFMAAVKKADNKGYKPNECRQIKDWHKDIWSHNRNINENLSESNSIKEDIEHNNKLVIEVKSGISADGFNCTIYDSTDKVVYKREYSYGYNASYNRDWADTDAPYVTDIINDLCAKYSIDKSDIKIVAGKNTFKGTTVSTDDVEKFKQKYLNEDYVINEDQYGRYSDTFKKIIREYTDSALIVGLVDDIVRYAKEADLRDLYFEKGYDKLKDNELIESIDEKDILHKLDQFTSKITINKDDEKALKDILLKKNVSFKIDDSKADKLTFKLNYKKLNEDLSENGQTVQRYIDSEIPDILVSLSDKLPNMYSSDIDVLVKSCRSFYNLCESLVMYYNKHTKIEEDLTDVATATLEGPQEGAQFGLAGLVNEAIQKELATVDEYNTLAINARSEGFEDIVNVINEINTEENKHIGQLQELLKTLSPNAEAIDVGKVEGEQQLEEEVNKDTKSPNTNDDILVEEDDNVDWKPIYDKFKQIEKNLNNDGEAVTAVIDKMYLDNKDDPAYVKAFQVWSEQ